MGVVLGAATRYALPQTMPTAATILVADDQDGHRAVMEMLLSVDGHRVVLAADGREALDYLKTNTPDLAVLDVNMPYASGIDICGRMRQVKRLREVPVIILTSLEDDRTHAEARMAGVTALVNKPLAGKNFRATVREVLAGARDGVAEPRDQTAGGAGEPPSGDGS